MAEVTISPVGDGSGIEESKRFFAEEIQLALRNKAMPLEGLRWDITPTGGAARARSRGRERAR